MSQEKYLLTATKQKQQHSIRSSNNININLKRHVVKIYVWSEDYMEVKLGPLVC